MSKFNNPSRALAPPAPPVAAAPPVVRHIPAPPQPAYEPDRMGSIEEAPPGEAPLIGIGFAVFCIFLISGMVNDWALLIFGGKGYISAVMVLVTPAIWLMGGNALRGFRDKTGMAWLLLVGFMLMSIPFSVWKSDSLAQIINYVSRSLCFFYYISSFTTSLKRCRRLMMVNIGVACMILVSCFKFGAAGAWDGRFQIPNSMFVGNSNDLALQLNIALTEFMFLFYLKGMLKRLIGLAGILASLFYMLKTGSRGSVLALAVVLVLALIFSKQRLKVAVVMAPLLLLAVLFMPDASSRRLLLTFTSAPTATSSASDASAIQSKNEREQLLQKSLSLTLQHPLLGVGMGEFVAAVMGENARKGVWAPSVGTHNSYTQVSSECGIPALICYVAVIWFTLQRSYRLYRMTAQSEQFNEIEGLAFSLLIGTIMYAIATFFFHIAYSGLLPMLSGETMALYSIAYPMLTRRLAVAGRSGGLAPAHGFATVPR